MSPELYALGAVFITAIAAPFVATWQTNHLAIQRENRAEKRAEVERKRAEEREDRVAELAVEAAARVQDVAVKLEKSDEVNANRLNQISATSNATHAIVNNQRTEMLRNFAVVLRVAAKDHPEDPVLVAAALTAAKDLEQNVEENADPATKVITPQSEPVKVEIVNTEPVDVDQVDKPEDE